MAKLSKLKVGDVKSFYEDVTLQNFELSGSTIAYKQYLTISEKISFVQDFFELCFIKGIYYPVLFDFALRTCTISYYTNLLVPEGEKKANNLAYGSGVYEELIKHININEHKALIEATEQQIEIYLKEDPFAKVADIISEYLGTEMEALKTVDFETLSKLLEVVNRDENKKDLAKQFARLYIKGDEVGKMDR